MAEDDDDACHEEPAINQYKTLVFRQFGVAYNAHSLPSTDQGRNANHKANGREYSPAPTSVAESNEDSCDNAADNSTNTKAPCKDHTRPVAVTDGPSNEVGVGLMTERPFDCVHNSAESSRVRSVGQGVKQSGALLRGEIELARCSIGNVDGNYSRDLLSKWLDRDCKIINECSQRLARVVYSQGCHLRSAFSKAPAAFVWNDLLVLEWRVEPLSLQAYSVGATLSLSLDGVLGGVLKGFPFTSATLAMGGAKSVPLKTAAVSALTFCFSGAPPVVACASCSACSADHTGARERSFGGSSEKRLA